MIPTPIDARYLRRLAAIHAELGIPEDYALSHRLGVQGETENVVSIGPNDSGRACLLTPDAARAWTEMCAAAALCEVVLVPLSGFRSVERQVEIVRGKLAIGEKLSSILRTIAAPGYSEHHTGCAIDIGTPNSLPLEESFADTKAFAWLERHAGEFNFVLTFPRGNEHGLIFEPWHWRWQ